MMAQSVQADSAIHPDPVEARLEAGLRHWPTDASLHVQLASLRWLRGLGEQSMALLEQAIADYPGELRLRLVAADLLRRGGFAERALTILNDGLRAAPESAAFLTSIGVVLDGMQRPAEALAYLRKAVARAPQSPSARRNLTVTLLRVGEPAEALALINELSASAPDDQQLIAYRAIAFRMLGDPAYPQLYDYPRLVRSYRLQPPAGFANELSKLHCWQQWPLEQSLRGGTQTGNNLPGDNPVIAAFFAMLDAPVRDYIARLDNSRDHPTDRRKRSGYRLSGSWSVRLRPGGFHINHVHPMGWLSSAYYVEVPHQPEHAQPSAGWLKFGEPDMPMPGCTPDHFVAPEPGMLVLFPSYLWHGTVPFEHGEQRLTAAFDVVPE
jgi:Flp pilus assembly protein TadD